MEKVITRLSLDLHSTNAITPINTKQGDNRRRIEICLVDGGEEYIISPECFAIFTARKPDGTRVYNSCTIENNTICYDITEQNLVSPGRINCEIALYGADGGLITSPKFVINNLQKVYDTDDELETTDEFSALTDQITKAIAATNAATEAARDIAEAKENGEFDGFSPNVSVEKIDGGHRVTITDKDGTNTFDVMDGEDGKDDTGGGLEPLIVTIDKTTGNANHNTEDILAQIDDGGNVYMHHESGYFPVSYADVEYAEFEIISPDAKTKTVHKIYSDSSAEEYSVTFATKDEIGDLDAALAEILDYAQSLTGGGES